MLKNMALMSYLDALRIDKKLTIEHVVKDVVSRRSYSRYLTGNTVIAFETMVKFLNNMNVSIREFSFYVFQSLNLNHPDEVLFIEAIQIDDIELAKKLYDKSLKGKTLITELGEKVIPVGIPYMLYRLGEMTKERAYYEMSQMIHLTNLINTSMIQDSMIISLFLYVRIASDYDKLKIFDYLYNIIKSKDSSIFAERYEYAQMLLYVTAIQCLTTLPSLSKTQERQVNAILRKALEFHKLARIHTVDYFLFKLLNDYIHKFEIKNEVVTYYYVAAFLSTPSSFLKQQKLKITATDYQAYLNCINDTAFYQEEMYERLIKHGIYK